jgi:hypothetical protein
MKKVLTTLAAVFKLREDAARQRLRNEAELLVKVLLATMRKEEKVKVLVHLVFGHHPSCHEESEIKLIRYCHWPSLRMRLAE